MISGMSLKTVLIKPKSRIRGTRAEKYRSKFEKTLADSLLQSNTKYEYETLKLEYTLTKSYSPDFILENGVIIEAKGVLTSDDRRKMKAVKEQHPSLDIRFVFQNSSNKLNRKSKTTYAKWAETHGFLWANKRIPKKWLKPLEKSG